MIVFKQVMGFVMLATVVYLISFMPIASVVPTVLLLLGIGLALWYAGQTPAYESTGRLIRAWSVATVMAGNSRLFSLLTSLPFTQLLSRTLAAQ